MEQKNKLLEQLLEEYNKLTGRREELMLKVETERDEYEEDNPNPVLEDCIAELQSLVSHIFDLENAIRQIKGSGKKPKKVGESVKIGDLVTLKGDTHHKQYYITQSSDYVNPALGIISPNSPIGQAIIGSKFGETINLQLNGMQLQYELAP